MLKFVRIVLVVCCLAVVYADEVTVITGVGASFPWPIYTDWSYAYSLVNSDVLINYTSTSAQERIDFVKSNSTATFYSPNALLKRDDAELFGEQDSLQLIPLTIGSLVPIYNLPNLAYVDGTEGTPQLVLSTSVLADIYRGRITEWNDTRILNDNPNVILPEAAIIKVLEKTGSGYTYALQHAFSTFVSDWEYTSTYTWPTNITTTANTVLASSDFGLFSILSSRENSITCVPYSQLITQTIGLTQSNAMLKNQRGEVVGPEEQYVLAAQEGEHFDKYMFGTFTNSNNSGSYPLTLTSFVTYRLDIDQDCEKLREFFKFMYFTKTDAKSLSRLRELGFSRFSSSLNDQILNFLETATCKGHLILYTKITTQHDNASFPTYLALGLIFLGISIILGAVWQYLNKSRCSKVVVMYQAILLVGITLTYISIVFWYLVPDQDYICQLRVWFTTIGYSLILTAMFERTWQIKRVYGKVMKGTNLAATVTGFMEIGGGISIIISIQLVIMIVWTVVDPLKSSIRLIDDKSFTFEGSYECISTNPGVWLLLEALYFAILLFNAIWIVYSTWSIRNFIVESRWILIAMYNILLFLALLATLFATVRDLDDDLLFNIMSPFILLSTTTIVVAVYAPSVLKEMKLIVSTNSNSGSNHTKTEEMSNSKVSRAHDEKKQSSQEHYDIEMHE